MTGHSHRKGGKPGHRSPQLAARNREWLELQEAEGWTVERIARQANRSTRAVRAALASARSLRDRPEVSDADRSKLAAYILANPKYKNDQEFRAWAEATITPGARPHKKDPPQRPHMIPVVRPGQAC